jgi:hypothetical protein
MGKIMWHKMRSNKGAPGGGEGEMFWVSEKTKPLSFQPQSNNDQEKIQLSEPSRETHLVRMTTCALLFADEENNKHFQPIARLKESLNTKGITPAAFRIDQKLTHKRGFECN